jgi:DNA-binding MarR family transcriptional regulator
MPQTSVHETADLVHSAAIHVLRRAGERDAESGITRARLSALSVIVFRGPITLGDLARAEGVRSATMTNIVTGLENEGLARRKPNAADGRSVLVAATPAGTRALQRGRARRIDAVAARLADLDAEELAVVQRAAELLEQRFGLRPWRPLGAATRSS